MTNDFPAETKTFNSFFARRLKPTARPITSPTNPSIIVSPADCRLTAYETVDRAKTFWYRSIFPAFEENLSRIGSKAGSLTSLPFSQEVMASMRLSLLSLTIRTVAWRLPGWRPRIITDSTPLSRARSSRLRILRVRCRAVVYKH